jgi:ankyrin repeat protein
MQRAFFMAATAGNTGELRRLLQDCPDLLHSRGPMRMTGLCYAASAGRFDSVRFLVDEGAVINHDDIDGNTPLSYACINGDAPLVRLLLERGAHPHRRETEGNDAFRCGAMERASTHTHTHIYKGSHMHTRMTYDGSSGTSAVSIGCVRVGAKAVAHVMYVSCDSLRMACEQGHLEVVRCFVELPTKHLNSSNRRGQSGLWLSCSRGHAAVAHLLLTAGADPTAAARGGATAFDVAVSRGHDACVRLLGVSGVAWSRVVSITCVCACVVCARVTANQRVGPGPVQRL